MKQSEQLGSESRSDCIMQVANGHGNEPYRPTILVAGSVSQLLDYPSDYGHIDFLICNRPFRMRRFHYVLWLHEYICMYLEWSSSWGQGPVVQSIVSLTSSLRVISLTVLADSIYNILIFFAEKMWVAFALTFFQQKISAYLRITRCNF